MHKSWLSFCWFFLYVCLCGGHGPVTILAIGPLPLNTSYPSFWACLFFGCSGCVFSVYLLISPLRASTKDFFSGVKSSTDCSLFLLFSVNFFVPLGSRCFSFTFGIIFEFHPILVYLWCFLGMWWLHLGWTPVSAFSHWFLNVLSVSSSFRDAITSVSHFWSLWLNGTYVVLPKGKAHASWWYFGVEASFHEGFVVACLSQYD